MNSSSTQYLNSKRMDVYEPMHQFIMWGDFKGNFYQDASATMILEVDAKLDNQKYWEAGGNCNMAIAAVRLGLRCIVIGHVGDEIYGKFLLDVLQDEGIKVIGMREADDIINNGSSNAHETLLCWVLVDPLQRHGFCSRAAISLIKGMEVKKEGPCMISALISQQLGVNCCVLMGANIANEIAVEKFSEATVGYRGNREIAERWVKLFSTPYFAVSPCQDVEGVELCGTLKNIVAISAGSFDELEAEMLQGQKLQGVSTAKEVYEVLKHKGWLEMFPLFTTVHEICIGRLPPSAIVEYGENAPKSLLGGGTTVFQ